MVFPTIGLDQERNLDACVDYTLATTTGNREHDNHNFKESPNRSAWHRVQRIAKSQCLAPSPKNRQIAVPGTEFKESPNRSAWHRVKESPNRSAWHRVNRRVDI